jgi:magnesium chelatase family protein
MLAKVKSFALFGLEGIPIEVETDINNGMPSYELVGLPDAAVKE